MGLFDWIFGKPKADPKASGYFQMLNGYTPRFVDAPGSVYEMDLTRAAIHAFASQCSKLKPEVTGSARKDLERILQFKPNPFMDTTKFIYRVATILECNGTAFIVPIEEDKTVVGFFPIIPQMCEVIEYNGNPYLRYQFGNGNHAAIEMERVGILTKFQYKDDFFGENNNALYPTMQLLTAQNQGIVNGVKNSASIRFLAKLVTALKDADIDKERKRFASKNLSMDNNSGVIMYDAKYDSVTPIDSKPYTVSAEQMDLINRSVYDYFGTNEHILQNCYSEDEWNAYYEGKIEPFALQLSLVLTNMLFTEREIAFGNSVHFSASRLQYASNATKLQVSTEMFDRGLISYNTVAEIWNLPTRPDGDQFYMRKEYAQLGDIDKGGETDAVQTE